MQNSQPLLSQRDLSVEEHRASRKEQKKSGKLFVGVTFIYAVICLAGSTVIICTHMTENPAFHHPHYLDNMGVLAVGVLISGAIFMVSTIGDIRDVYNYSGTFPGKKYLIVDLRSGVNLCKAATGTSSPTREVFGEKASTLNRVSGVVMDMFFFASNLISFAVATYTAFGQERNPDVPFDFTQRMIPAFEFTLSFLWLMLFVMACVGLVLEPAARAFSYIGVCKSMLKRGSCFSAASSLGIGKGVLEDTFKLLKTGDLGGALVGGFMSFMFLAIGVAALNAKVATVNFLNKGADNLSYVEWITLLALAKNVFTMSRSMDEIEHTEGEFLYRDLMHASSKKGDGGEVHVQHLETLIRDLITTYAPLGALVIVLTFSRGEAKKKFQFDCLQNSIDFPRSSPRSS